MSSAEAYITTERLLVTVGRDRNHLSQAQLLIPEAHWPPSGKGKTRRFTHYQAVWYAIVMKLLHRGVSSREISRCVTEDFVAKAMSGEVNHIVGIERDQDYVLIGAGWAENVEKDCGAPSGADYFRISVWSLVFKFSESIRLIKTVGPTESGWVLAPKNGSAGN